MTILKDKMTDTISCKTWWVKIYIAGDYDKARDICRKYCMKGLCVNISKTNYIYTMGEESGVCVELINYPPFSKTDDLFEITYNSVLLGNKLLEELCQASYTIMTPEETYYVSRKREIKEKNHEKDRLTPQGDN